jgi:catechol 2,3-dioxygenase-like lactoylglutathione lyase family enzyme
MSILTLHHGGRTVADMEKALSFYRDLLGMQVVDDDVLEGPEISTMVDVENARLRAVFLSPDGEPPYVELIEYQGVQGRALDGGESAADIGNTHVCLLVDDITAECARLRRAGVRFNGPPLYTDAGFFKGEWAAYCYDPDGGVVELWARSGPTEG